MRLSKQFDSVLCYTKMKSLTTLGLIATLFSAQEYPVVYAELPFNNIFMVYEGQDREIPLCQFGFEQRGVRFVTGLKIPYIIESTDSMAQFNISPCNSPFYLGIIHNHPKGYCSPGELDLDRFINDERASIETIVCDVDMGTGAVTMNHTLKEDLPDSIIRKYKR